MAGRDEYRLTLTAEIAKYDPAGGPLGERLTVTEELALPELDFQESAKILGELLELARRRAGDMRQDRKR